MGKTEEPNKAPDADHENNTTTTTTTTAASPTKKASAVISVEVNTEGDVQLQDHEIIDDDKDSNTNTNNVSPTASLSAAPSNSSSINSAGAGADADRSPTTTTNKNGTITAENNSSAEATAATAAELSTTTEASDLSRPRHIYVVTTAALPWRTGTAVNPMLRALSLLPPSCPVVHKSVSLLVPWLDSLEARQSLYGSENSFENSGQQEAWIRNYCVERCNCTTETVDQLKIQFWPGVYHESFGSIFPTLDICSLIPKDTADVCILEEPEHLNWFRVPPKDSSVSKEDTTVAVAANNNKNKINSTNHYNTRDADVLGWAHKFQHVVGILHTNYADYVRQYGYLGTSMLTAPALTSLSSLVVKAYCHRVIRLSATLPRLDDDLKEVTSNVHGVRHEFLEPPAETTKAEEESDDEEQQKQEPAAVYFVGKLIWAKGFENVLHVQEKFKAATGAYFPMDIYGGGKDEKDIRKAFFGRRHHHHKHKTASRSSSNVSDSSASTSNKEIDQKAAAVFGTRLSLRDQLCGRPTAAMVDDENVVTVDTATGNVVQSTMTTTENEPAAAPSVPSAPASEASWSGRTTPTNVQQTVAELLATPNVPTPPILCASPPLSPSSANNDEDQDDDGLLPLEIFGDLSQKTINTSVDTADAALKLLESVVVGAGFGGDDSISKGAADKGGKRGALGFHLAPAKTRFKWRRNPIPARFLGVQDHIIVREIPEHKIFLNMSTSEVLCTTSAEALAMGKFVVLPKHPSNEFFLQFPNCLAYETIDQCVLKLQYALENEPEPLTEKYRHMLSWEGATERLVKASAITKGEAEEKIKKGLDKSDLKAAKFHVDAAKKSQFVGSILRGKILK